MKTNKKGIDLIKEFEGCRLTAYVCQGGKWTIGYGHTKGVKKGDKITQAQADSYLIDDLKDAEKAVNALVTVSINQNMFDALVSFVFNVGTGNFKSSTLLKLLNEGRYSQASDEFLRWVYVTVNGEKQKSNGLVRRRETEQSLFRSAIEAPKQKENLLSHFIKWLFSLISKKK